MDLVLTFLGCSVVGFSITYWSDIKNSIQGKMTISKPLKDFVGKSLREEYYEAYEYLAREFGVRTNVLLETTDEVYRVRFVKECFTNQPKCLIPATTYNDEEFMQHFITIAELYKELQGDELLKKYLNLQESDLRNRVSQRLLELGITHKKGGGNSSW